SAWIMVRLRPGRLARGMGLPVSANSRCLVAVNLQLGGGWCCSVEDAAEVGAVDGMSERVTDQLAHLLDRGAEAVALGSGPGEIPQNQSHVVGMEVAEERRVALLADVLVRGLHGLPDPGVLSQQPREGSGEQGVGQVQVG